MIKLAILLWQPITRVPVEDKNTAFIWWIFSATIFAGGVFINTYLSSIAAKKRLEALDIQFRGTRLISFESVGKQIEDLREMKQITNYKENKRLVDIELTRIGNFWKAHTSKKTFGTDTDIEEMKEGVLQQSIINDFLEFQEGKKNIAQILGLFSLVNSSFDTNFTVADADKVIGFIRERI